MSDRPVRILLLSYLLTSSVCAAQEDTEKTARAFLPPRARFAHLMKYDSRTGKPMQRSPAILAGSVVSPGSRDIVFAYETHPLESDVRSLFVALIHKTEAGYIKAFEVAYYGRYLWVQDFTTVGFKLLPLPDTGRSAVVVITAVGASLGATIEVFRWDESFGLVNVFPRDSGAYHITFGHEKGWPVLELRFEKYPGEKETPPPFRVRWDGKSFVKIP